MTKVPTLRCPGLCVSTLLVFAACSGTPAPHDDATAGVPSETPMAESGRPTQEPQTGAPQGQGQEPSTQGLVEQALKNARLSLERRLFEDARNEAAFALELDNQNAAAREILRRCNEVLGDRPPTVGGRFADMILQDRIAAERERYLVEKELQTGAAHMEQKSYGNAKEAFERALTTLRFSPHFQPNDPLRKQAEEQLEAASKAKLQADEHELDKIRAASESELQRMAQDQQAARGIRIQRLMEDANTKFQAGQYQGAVDSIDQALQLDPTNATAAELRDLADRARHTASMEYNKELWRQEWEATITETQHANMPQTETVVFDPVRWLEVSQRKPVTYTPPAELDSPENRAIRKKLEETVLDHNFAVATVQEWATYYGTVTGVTFVVGPDVVAMEADKTTLNDFRLPRRSVADALRVIAAQTGVAHKIRDGIVHLVGPEHAIGTLYLERYMVSDLVQGIAGKPGPDLKLKPPDDDSPLFPEADAEPAPSVVDDGRLQEMLQAAVAPDKWGGSPFTMGFLAGMLLVRADKDTQDAVGRLINDLRRNVGIQVDVESRFLKVEDNFLEDVGVDLRGLGNQASQGVPGRGLEKHGPRPNAGFDDFGPSQLQNPATPGPVGTGTEPGIFFDDGGDGDYMARVENLYTRTLGGTQGGLTNAGGLSLQYAFLDDTEVEIVLRAVSKQERSEQIEAPRLLIYNNTRASMHFLRNISYIKDFEVEIAQAAAVANPVIGVVHDGVALDVRPVVDADLQFITMELRPTVMALQLPIPTFTTTLGVGQPISIQLPEVTLQRVRTTVTMPDGGTMMLGGMRLHERQRLESTVPVLGDIPLVSFLFSRQGTSMQNRKILILIRAKIVLMEELEPVPMVDNSAITARR